MGLTSGPELATSLEPQLGWAKKSGPKAGLLLRILESVAEPSMPGAVIPVVSEKEIRFYACASTPAAWAQLRQLLMAYVGVTLSDFDGTQRSPEVDDAISGILRSAGADKIGLVHPRPGRAREVVDALAVMIEAVRSAPRETEIAPRSTPQLLTSFRMALAAGDRETASSTVAVLRAQMRLDALNLAFLEVQSDAALADWRALRDRWFFTELCSSRRPPRVTAALAEALYWCEIAPELKGLDGPGLVEVFRQRCLGRYGRLFTVLPPNPAAPVAIMFLLAAAAGPLPDRATAKSILEGSTHWDAADSALVSGIARLLFDDAILDPAREEAPRPGSTPALEGQVAGLRAGVAPGLADAQGAIRAAYALQTLAATRLVVDAINLMSPGDRHQLLSERALAAIWDDLTAAAGERSVPASWTAFLASAAEMPFHQARSWAESAIAEIPITNELDSPARVSAFIDQLQQTFAASEQTVDALLPHLLEWARSEPEWPDPTYRDLYAELLNLVLLGVGRSTEVVAACALLVSGLLAVGIDVKSYRRLLADLAAWVPTAVAPRSLDQLIDLADVVASVPCPDEAARSGLWMAILAALNPFSSRLSPVQVGATAELCRVLGGQEWVETLTAEPSGTADGDRKVLPPGFLIVIYTLMESAGRRIQGVLQKVHPEARVELATDHVANPRLVQLAERAQLFVVCWASAKHAATEAIGEARPSALPTLYPVGVGSSSVLRDVETYLAEISR